MSKPFKKRLKHSKRIRSIRRLNLADIPVLHDTSALHTIEINKRKLLSSRKIDLEHHSSVIIVVVPAQDIVFAVREDRRELLSDAVAALRVVRAVLDEVFGNVLVEGIDYFLVSVPGQC